ncbi:class I SAM-dependent methyltransferase [Lysobacter sp. A3-1-A15]|uniref:class I SAM-dependent methyltransferase n=1 Tax=Novilysobacter viscosus TaxID=3098602 RepID=UPI002EDAC95F
MAQPTLSCPVAGWRSLADWQRDRDGVLHAEQPAIDAALADGGVEGRCDACGHRGRFALVDAAALREGLPCPRCRCNARQRAAARLLLSTLAGPAAARVYLTEQASPLFIALRRRVGRLVGSEFARGPLRRLRLSAWLWRQRVPAWVRHQDITALRMRPASLDAVVSLDVLEHVPDYAAGLRGFVRVLRPGGVLVLTVPFYECDDAHRQIARLGPDGGLLHDGPAEYHGDPLGGGVPCFHHFGWSLLGALREAGFADACMVRVADVGAALPRGQWVVLARR